MNDNNMKRIALLILCPMLMAGCTSWKATSDSNAIRPNPVVVTPSEPAETEQTQAIAPEPTSTPGILAQLATQAEIVPGEESLPMGEPSAEATPTPPDAPISEAPAITGGAAQQGGDGPAGHKTITIEVEGMREDIDAAPHEGSFTSGPSFTIYVDEARYVFSESTGIYMLAPLDDPEGENVSLMIEFLSGKDMATIVSELTQAGHADKGDLNMDSLGTVRYISGDVGGLSADFYLVGTGGGVFKAAIYSMPEYAEGHGARLYQLLRTTELN